MGETFQDWCIDTTLYIVQNKNNYHGTMGDKGYKCCIKNIVGLYSEMYLYPNGQKEHLGLWWDALGKGNAEQFFSPLLVSEEARGIVEELNKKTKKKDADITEYQKSLRLEHITPKSYIYAKLCELVEQQKAARVERADVERCFQYSKLVLLSKNESKKYLDAGNNGANSVFSDEDFKKLQEWATEYPELESLGVGLAGIRCREFGPGPLRIIHLLNNGIRFCYMDSNKQFNNTPKDFMDYLNNATFEITDQ